MPELEVLSDVDQVFCDFQGPAIEIIYMVTGIRIDPEELEDWDVFNVLKGDELALEEVYNHLRQPGFCTSLVPYPEAQEAVEKLRKIVNVTPVTSPFRSPTWVFERDLWLEKHFGFHRNQNIHTAAKYKVKGDLFLDDKPDHIWNWEKANPGKTALLWHIPNTKHIKNINNRVKTWAEVFEHVERLRNAP